MSTIAIVDDDAQMRSLMTEWLTGEGYRVGETESDLVVVDVYMPRQFGFGALRSARARYPGVPIIAISGQFQPDVQCAGPAAAALGVDRVIAKPFSREALLESVRSVIGRPTHRRLAPHARTD